MEKALIYGGKFSWKTMEKLIRYLPTEDPDLILGPSIGEDAAVIRFKDGFLVVHSDPITAATSRIGWLSINIAANDIAVRGARPRWFLPVILIPREYSLDTVREIFRDMGNAAKMLDSAIIGGHTEITPGLPRPVISMTAIGYSTDKVVLTRNAQPGDQIYVIGRIGGEGVGVIAHDLEEELVRKGVNRETIENAKKFIYDISVVDKALLVKNYVNSMHDPTEGGIIQGLREVAVASKTRIVVDLDKARIDRIVSDICGLLGIDPFKLLSSGSLIASVPIDNTEEFENVLTREKIEFSHIGSVESKSDRGELVIKYGGKTDIIDEDVIDEIYKLLS